MATLLHSMEQNKLLLGFSSLLVAVSGGADSLALLHALIQARESLQVHLHVATLNHGLRGQAAVEDAEYVQELCETWGVPVTIGFRDVAALAQAEGISIETAARQARYHFLAEVAQTVGAKAVVTAHHADDQAETILMHLLRGAGLQGLVGMSLESPLPYSPHLRLIRPLLSVSRAEIEAYCQANGLIPRHDATNDDQNFLRNAIRLDLLPYLSRYNPQIREALVRLADISAIEQDYLTQTIEAQIAPYLQIQQGRIHVPLDVFQHWHLAIQRRALYSAATLLGAEVSFQHVIQALQVLQTGRVGAIAEFTNFVRLRIGYQALYIERSDAPLLLEDYLLLAHDHSFTIPTQLDCGSWQLRVQVEALDGYHARLAIPEGAELQLRTRRIGDEIAPLGLEGQHRSLKKIMIDRKIPKALRDKIPVLLVNGVIAALILPEQWLISEVFKVQGDKSQMVYFRITAN